MDKKKLRQYQSLKREQKMLEDKMEKLNERAERIPTVAGTVKGSMSAFPYIETHMSVVMSEPKQADMIDRQMRINERRREQVDKLLTEIEEFISQIPDSNTRQIFELIYLNGNTQQEVGDQLGYSKGRISQIISENLKD
jgi:RNA polymerase sigma factor (sigma-70 family)|nr:MAG TPA: Sigma-70, region 4 [Caudoviricetes sp.]